MIQIMNGDLEMEITQVLGYMGEETTITTTLGTKVLAMPSRPILGYTLLSCLAQVITTDSMTEEDDRTPSPRDRLLKMYLDGSHADVE